MTIPWLLQDIRSASKTGTAVFSYVRERTADKVEKKVYFKGGDVVFAASNLHEERLGDLLLRQGKINQQQFDVSTELILKTRKKQGAILVDLGFIAPQDLVTGVKQQIKEIILGLFAVRMGTYRFDEGPLPVADIIPLQMSTGNLILEGINNLPWDSIRRALPAPNAVIRPSLDPSSLFQSAHLSADQNAVLALVDGKLSIEELCRVSGLGDFNCMKIIYVLLALRMTETGAVKTPEEIEFAREVVRETVHAHEEKPRAPEPEFTMTREQLEQAHAALEGRGHYEVLGLSRTATPHDVKKAYFRLAKAYHPDRHFEPEMADMKGKLETLFDRIHTAYVVLSDAAQRASYDLGPEAAKKAAPPPEKKDEFEEQHPEDYQENYKEKAARAAEWFAGGMKEFKVGNFWGAAESFTWAVRLDPIKAPYFFFHGLSLSHVPRRRHEAEESLQKAVELDPTKVEYHLELSNLYVKSGLRVKALAVLNAALSHHPNSDQIMSAIREAGTQAAPGQTAQDKRAAETKQEPRPEPAAGRATGRGKAQFDAGMKEFRGGNFWGAADAFGAALRLDPADASAHFYHGLSLCHIPRRRSEAEQSLRRAVELDPKKAEYHLELGNYYLKDGLKAKALGVLSNALLILPQAAKIKEAIKAIGGAGAEPAAEEKKSGLFSKIFKSEK